MSTRCAKQELDQATLAIQHKQAVVTQLVSGGSSCAMNIYDTSSNGRKYCQGVPE